MTQITILTISMLACAGMSLIILQRLGPMSSLFFASSFNTLSMIAFLIVLTSSDLNTLGSVTALPLERAGYNSNYVSALFICICAFYTAVSIIISKLSPRLSTRNQSITTFLSNTLNKNYSLIQLLGIFLFLWSALHFIDIDIEKLWENNSYLALLNPDAAGIDTALGKLYNTSQRYIGIIALVFFYISLRSKKYSISIIYGIIITYVIMLSLARASRYVPVFLALFLIMDTIYIRKINATKLILSLSVIISYVLVILMRREPIQGLASIGPAILSFEPASTIQMLQGILINAFQGAVILDLSITTPASHLAQYKILSFSPLPGLIDGFPLVRSASEIRITPFNPMNSYGEAYHFGFVYVVAWTLISTFAFAVVDTSLRKSANPLSLAALIIAMLFILVLSQYQLRTSIKFASLVIAMGIPALFFTYYKIRRI